MQKISFLVIAAFLFTSVNINAQDTTHKDLVGKYKFPAGSVVEDVVVAMESGTLTMNSSAGVSTLELIKGDTFNIVSFNGIAVFKRNETRKVTGVHIDASGYILDGVKDSVATHISISNFQFAPSIANTQLNTSLSNDAEKLVAVVGKEFLAADATKQRVLR